jgi:serine/threonine-protein kinase
MTDDESRIMALVEEILDSNASPEEACREFPQLLPGVRIRLERFRSVEAKIGEVFPPRGSTSGVGMGRPRVSRTLPTIPGYEVLETLGAGGMGVVYRARQTKLNRVVAVKMLLAGGYAGDRELERFKREAEAVAALRHPNIVQVYDAGEHDGFPYFAMEFMDAGTLNRALAGAPQTARKAAETTATLARAVHAAHLAGIVHRDLKPGNVLLASDGAFKIADFGVARRLDGAQGHAVTLEGAHVGTPSYMSPEQAMGRGVGPATDVYSLGAILYEMLTGRPPFRGETGAETERQVIHDDPVHPSLLNPRTARDLETICLKCLQKTSDQRYASALGLAEDLDRFLSGDAIRARPVSWAERTLRWVRKRPAQTALVLTASLLLVLGASAGAGAWRSAARRSAEIAAWTPRLDDIRKLESQGKLQDARALLPRPLDVEATELRSQVQSALAELDLARKLDAIRDGRQEIVNGRFDFAANLARCDKAYEAAIGEAGFGRVGDEPSAVAAGIKRSPIQSTLVAALDDWSACCGDDARGGWVMEVARGADDPDPSGWRDRARKTGLDAAALSDLAKTAEVEHQSPKLLVALAMRMREAGAKGLVPFLGSVQRQYPGDWWACYMLGEALFENNPAEAVRFYQAALASHPESALGHHAVGRALSNANRPTEAIVHFREAHDREPTFAEAKSDLGWALCQAGQAEEGLKWATEAVNEVGSAKSYGALGAVLEWLGRGDEAIGAYRRSIALDPRFFWAHLSLAKIFDETGRPDESTEELECCRRLNPESGWVHIAIAGLLRRKNRYDEAMVEFNKAASSDAALSQASAHSGLGDCWRLKGSPQMALVEFDRALLLDPSDLIAAYARREVMVQLGLGEAARADWERALEAHPSLWQGYAELCIYLNDQDAYERECHRLLDYFGSDADPRNWEHVGRACLLGVIPPADAERAAALIERAVQAELPTGQSWERPYFLVAQGLARYRRDDFDGAVSAIGPDSQAVLGPLPHLVLAMAHQRAGRRSEALRSFTHALEVFDWDQSHMTGPDDWMHHALRREAEGVVMPNLDALLAGRDVPRDQDERLALVAVCQSTQRFLRAAALCAEAFKADPDMADHPETGRRYAAACCAARAGHGDGRDADSLSDEERARWRTQARDWLKADLPRWSAAGVGGSSDRELAYRALSHWRADPDLSGLRDPGPLAALSPAERAECQALWSDVDATIARAHP